MTIEKPEALWPGVEWRRRKKGVPCWEVVVGGIYCEYHAHRFEPEVSVTCGVDANGFEEQAEFPANPEGEVEALSWLRTRIQEHLSELLKVVPLPARWVPVEECKDKLEDGVRYYARAAGVRKGSDVEGAWFRTAGAWRIGGWQLLKAAPDEFLFCGPVPVTIPEKGAPK